MLAIVVGLLVQAGPVIAPRHPRAASPWSHSVRAACGRNVITIDGYGGGRPLGMTARLRVNNLPLTGRAVPQLLADISHKRAVYRFEILCGELGDIGLRISEGEKLLDGPVRYRSAAASIMGNQLRSYTGFQDGDADGFWFR